jgi:hypothetical protein
MLWEFKRRGEGIIPTIPEMKRIEKFKFILSRFDFLKMLLKG